MTTAKHTAYADTMLALATEFAAFGLPVSHYNRLRRLCKINGVTVDELLASFED